MKPSRPSPKIDDELLERIAERLKLLADPMRLKILHSLEGEELCVSDILSRVGGTQANVSKHLSLLRRGGVLSARREGLNVFYRAREEEVFAICRSVCESLERQAAAAQRSLRAARPRRQPSRAITPRPRG